MTPNDPLAQLHPLRDPSVVSGWPPAPGWWLLTAVFVAALVAAAVWWLRRWQRNAYRRLGTASLKAIRTQWQQSGDDMQCLTRTNALLKAVALQAYPRRDIAATTGEAWLQFLNSQVAATQAFDGDALEAQYRQRIDTTDLAQHLDRAAHWIACHRVAR